MFTIILFIPLICVVGGVIWIFVSEDLRTKRYIEFVQELDNIKKGCGGVTKEIISADIVKVVGDYGIVKVKERLFINGKPHKATTWYDVCIDHGDGDIVTSYKTLKEAVKWAKEN